MPQGLEDAVRPWQLPDTAPAVPVVSQFNLNPNEPIRITPGFGSSGNAGGGQQPQIQTIIGHFSEVETFYMDMAATERLGS